VVEDPIKILVADERWLFRDAVKVVLEAEPDLEVVAEVRDGFQAVLEAERLRPDVVLLSADLASNRSLPTAEAISRRVPACRIVVVSHEEDPVALVDAMEAGVAGYLTKESPVIELLASVRAVHADGICVPERMVPMLIREFVRRSRDRAEAAVWLAALTVREREVLSLVADGADNAEIGRTLMISPQTARTHIHNILAKLGLHSRLEVAMFARQWDISDLVDRTPRIREATPRIREAIVGDMRSPSTSRKRG